MVTSASPRTVGELMKRADPAHVHFIFTDPHTGKEMLDGAYISRLGQEQARAALKLAKDIRAAAEKQGVALESLADLKGLCFDKHSKISDEELAAHLVAVSVAHKTRIGNFDDMPNGSVRLEEDGRNVMRGTSRFKIGNDPDAPGYDVALAREMAKEIYDGAQFSPADKKVTAMTLQLAKVADVLAEYEKTRVGKTVSVSQKDYIAALRSKSLAYVNSAKFKETDKEAVLDDKDKQMLLNALNSPHFTTYLSERYKQLGELAAINPSPYNGPTQKPIYLEGYLRTELGIDKMPINCSDEKCELIRGSAFSIGSVLARSLSDKSARTKMLTETELLYTMRCQQFGGVIIDDIDNFLSDISFADETDERKAQRLQKRDDRLAQSIKAHPELGKFIKELSALNPTLAKELERDVGAAAMDNQYDGGELLHLVDKFTKSNISFSLKDDALSISYEHNDKVLRTTMAKPSGPQR